MHRPYVRSKSPAIRYGFRAGVKTIRYVHMTLNLVQILCLSSRLKHALPWIFFWGGGGIASLKVQFKVLEKTTEIYSITFFTF